ncbi:MAG: M20 family metallopeptidase [Tropicimonas sp.]|uniref:M20 family metallopeptidase n=1 Tax=Tropicimonas sp. TaxID=2067044 RepID=UPI003A840DEB
MAADEVTGLLADLVGIESLSGDEGAVQRFIAEWFAAQDIPAAVRPAEGGLGNLIVEVDSGAPGRALFLGGHCDTVGIGAGWTRPPLRATIEEGRLYGRGAMDMKGGLAAAMIATRDLARDTSNWTGRLIFAALADEEAFSRGARGFLKDAPQIDAALMCEPHFDAIGTGAMGKINIDVEVRGRSAHASRPDEGINAVCEAARLAVVIGDLERPVHPEHGAASHCILNISSGDGAYEIRVPDRCAFRINWHLMPGETIEGALAIVEGLARRACRKAEVAVTLAEPAYGCFELAPDHALPELLAACAERATGRRPGFEFCHGVSDANLFMGGAGIPTVLFGPSGGGMHGADEWVCLDQLRQAVEIYRDCAQRFLAGRTEGDTDAG